MIKTQIHKHTNTNTQIQIYKYTTKNTKIQIHKYKYTNTNTQVQIHKYKYRNTNTQVEIHVTSFYDCSLRLFIRVHQKTKKFSKSHGLLIYFVPTWVKTISAKKMIFFAFSWLGHHVEKNGPCSRENEVKISKNRFLAIKSCRNMLQPSS